MSLPCCLPSFSWLLFPCSGSALQTPPVTFESSQLGFALCPKKRHCLLVKKWQIWSQRTVSLHLSNNVGWHRYPGSVQGPWPGQPRLLGLSQKPKSPQTVHELLASTQGLADDSSGCHWLRMTAQDVTGEIPGKGGPRVLLQLRELYPIPPYDFLLPKLATPQKFKKTHQEYSKTPIEVAQPQGTGFPMLWRQGSGPNQMWVNGLMEQTAPSFVGGGVRPGPVAWLWAPRTASLGVCLICSMRPLVSKGCF